MPTARDKPRAPDPGPAVSLEALTSTCAAVADEDDANAGQLDALIAELLPQLKVPK